MARDVITINQSLRSRQNKSGKQRYTINVQSEPLLHNLDASTLGKGVAEAIAETFRAKIRAIVAPAPASTLRARDSARAAFVRGAKWATKRYSGGRMGTRIPYQTDRAFNDSGRFAESIVARENKTEKAWTINVAANRLDDATSGGAVRIWRKLVTLVPAFGDPRLLRDEPRVVEAIEGTIDTMIQKVTDRTAELRRQRNMAGLQLLKSVVGV